MIAKKNKGGKKEKREREEERERESPKPYLESSRKEKKERIGRCIVIGRTKCH